MDRPDVFMPLYIGDYLAGTSRLTTELHGAYMLLIMDYWMNGCPPDDDHALASITKMSLDAWSIARAKLEHFFSIENGQWKHKRIEHELASAIEKKAKAADKAAKAAAARWEKSKNNAPSIPQAMQEECPSPSPSPSEDLKHIIPSERERIPAREVIELFNRVFTELPEVRLIDDKRLNAVKARWKATENLRSIEQWEKFFNWIKQSDFLMGRDKAEFKCSFDWIFKAGNFAKIYEGNYHK